MRHSWQTPSLTRGDIRILALAAHQAHVERMRAISEDLDDDVLPATACRADCDDVSISHDSVEMRPWKRPDAE
jgi:hypothetical protein